MPRVLWVHFFDSIFKTGMNCPHMGNSSSSTQNIEVAQTRLNTRLILFIYFYISYRARRPRVYSRTKRNLPILSENNVCKTDFRYFTEIFYFWQYNIKYNILQAQEQNDNKKLHTWWKPAKNGSVAKVAKAFELVTTLPREIYWRQTLDNQNLKEMTSQTNTVKTCK